MQKKCKVCDKEIRRKPSRQIGAKYCSISCYHKHQKEKTIKKEYVCKNCCGKYWLYPSRTYNGRTTRFCSAECMNENKRKVYNSPKAKKRREVMKGTKMRSVDNLFSKVIRSRDGKCLHCGKTENLQCSHVLPRTYISVRWNTENAITLCYRCHIYWWHKYPHEAVAWYDSLFPGKYQDLKLLAEQHLKIDRKEVLEQLRQELKKQEGIKI